MIERNTRGRPSLLANYFSDKRPLEDAKDMTLRDYFAAKVLATACEDHGPIEAAEMAYRYADAMLGARK